MDAERQTLTPDERDSDSLSREHRNPDIPKSDLGFQGECGAEFWHSRASASP
jgi:hypothetical protein